MLAALVPSACLGQGRSRARTALLASAALVGVWAVSPAQAQVDITFSGDTTAQPTFDRPQEGNPPTSTAGGAFNYIQLPFTVTGTGSTQLNWSGFEWEMSDAQLLCKP